jgi:YgiT-type zinc finger domain-containing protein
MKIKCPKCGQVIESKIGNYRYKESGLDNVYLRNILVYECSCGVSYPSIFRIGRLNELIAETLLEKQTLLSGKEIKFLRKSLY